MFLERFRGYCVFLDQLLEFCQVVLRRHWKRDCRQWFPDIRVLFPPCRYCPELCCRMAAYLVGW